MFNTEHDLYNYIYQHSIKNNIIDQKYFLESINRFNIGTILYKYIKKINYQLYVLIKLKLMQQKSFNCIVKSEIRQITKKLASNGLSVVQLKGLTLAEDLYDPAESRCFTDIDLLIRPKDLLTVLEIIKGLGYTIIDKNFPVTLTNHAIDNSSHHIKLKKGNIYLEIHTLLSRFLYNAEIDKIIDRTIRVQFEDYTVNVLNPNDYIIYLLVHFCRHYYTSCTKILGGRLPSWQCSSKSKNVTIEMPIYLLHDIALLIGKYHNVIKWEELLRQISEWHVCNEAKFAIHLLNRIYPERIPTDIYTILLKLPPDTGIGFEKQIFSTLINYDPDDIIFYDIEKLMLQITSAYRKDKIIINCFKRKRVVLKMRRRNYLLLNMYNGCIVDGQEPSSEKDCSLSFEVMWDKMFIIFYCMVKDDILIFLDNSKDPKKQDCIQIMFDIMQYTSQHRLFQLDLLPRWHIDGIILCIFDESVRRYISGEFYTYKIRQIDDGYEIELYLSWNYFGIKPVTSMTLGFDVAINDCDSVITGRKCKLQLGGRDRWMDPTIHSNLVLL